MCYHGNPGSMMEKRICAGREEGFYIEDNSLEVDEIEDTNVYTVERRKETDISLTSILSIVFIGKERVFSIVGRFPKGAVHLGIRGQHHGSSIEVF